eukprot:COSAG05_NODE_2624_length_2830_cov_2.644819_3_plen_98_part_00
MSEHSLPPLPAGGGGPGAIGEGGGGSNAPASSPKRSFGHRRLDTVEDAEFPLSAIDTSDVEPAEEEEKEEEEQLVRADEQSTATSLLQETKATGMEI